MFKSRRHRVSDLSVEAERIDYYERAIVHGIAELMLDSIDGILLMQVWDRLTIPGVPSASFTHQPQITCAAANRICGQ